LKHTFGSFIQPELGAKWKSGLFIVSLNFVALNFGYVITQLALSVSGSKGGLNTRAHKHAEIKKKIGIMNFILIKIINFLFL
jgi:hypothetical protein